MPSEAPRVPDPFAIDAPRPSTPPPAEPVALEDDWSDLDLGVAAKAAAPAPKPQPASSLETPSGLAGALGEEALPAKPKSPEARREIELPAFEEGERAKPIELAPTNEFVPPAEQTGHKPEPAAPPAVSFRPADGGEAQLREALSQASREVIERIAWEVVPELAETIIREQIDRLVKERQGQ
jgi:hypothetical protein